MTGELDMESSTSLCTRMAPLRFLFTTASPTSASAQHAAATTAFSVALGVDSLAAVVGVGAVVTEAPAVTAESATSLLALEVSEEAAGGGDVANSEVWNAVSETAEAPSLLLADGDSVSEKMHSQ
ncbi:hypothetical protein BBJ28_00024226 [Nothophytophthora sp. Chile5]|nr:hypothetical protein BBJ28_00024226 [Nothophytophthora sp. Chile5]